MNSPGKHTHPPQRLPQAHRPAPPRRSPQRAAGGGSSAPWVALFLILFGAAGFWAYKKYGTPAETTAPMDNSHLVERRDVTETRTTNETQPPATTAQDEATARQAKEAAAQAEAIALEKQRQDKLRTLLDEAETAWEQADYSKAYLLAKSVVDDKPEPALQTLALPLFERSRQAHWATRNIPRELFVGKPVVAKIRMKAGNEFYGYVAARDATSVTIAKSSGSVGLRMDSIDKITELKPEQFFEEMRLRIEPILRAIPEAPTDKDRAKFNDALKLTFANGVTPLMNPVMEAGLQRFPDLGTKIYEKEAARLIKRILYALGKNRTLDHKTIVEPLTALRRGYTDGDWIAQAETVLYGAPLAAGAAEPAKPALIENDPDAIASAKPDEAVVTIDAPKIADPQDPKSVLQAADKALALGREEFTKADPEAEEDDLDVRQAHLKKAVEYFLVATDYYARAIALIADAGQKTEAQEKLRESRKLLMVARKLKRID